MISNGKKLNDPNFMYGILKNVHKKQKVDG